MALPASNGMKNFHTTKIGLAALTIIFLLLYGYFSTLGKPLNTQFDPASQGFADSKIILGNLGGFHILKNINYSDETTFHRLIIETELNRSTASPENITIPYTVFAEAVSDTLKTPETTDQYQIKVMLSDTQVANIPQDKPLAIFESTNPDPNQPKLIQEIRVKENKDETSEILIQLTKKSLFRATADNSGALVLDILK